MLETLVVDVVQLDGSTVVFARGEVDLASAPLLRSALERAKTLGVSITVDFAGVTFMDSSGLNVLIHAQETPNGPDPVRVRNPSPQVRRLLDITGLTHPMSPHPVDVVVDPD